MFDSTRSDKIFQVINYAFLGFILLIVLYPLVFVLSASLSSPELLLKGEVWLLPKGLSFDSYARVFSNKDILTGYLNAIKYTIIGTAINVLMTIAAAYPCPAGILWSQGADGLYGLHDVLQRGLIPTFILVRGSWYVQQYVGSDSPERRICLERFHYADVLSNECSL